MNFFQMYRL